MENPPTPLAMLSFKHTFIAMYFLGFVTLIPIFSVPSSYSLEQKAKAIQKQQSNFNKRPVSSIKKHPTPPPGKAPNTGKNRQRNGFITYKTIKKNKSKKRSPQSKKKRRPSLIQQFYSTLMLNHINPPKERASLTYAAFDGMIGSLNDPYARFLPPKKVRKMVNRVSGKHIGVGLKLGLKNGVCTVITTYPNSPAKQAGLAPLDQLIQINDTPIKNLSLYEINQLLEGRPDSQVIIKFRRFTSPKTLIVAMRRKAFSTSPVPKTALFFKRIGYIKISSFEHKDTAKEFKLALNKLLSQGCTSLIIDLRENSGGILGQSVNILKQFVGPGPLVHIVRRTQKVKTISSNKDPSYPQLPLFVLVDEGSASASEILASGIQEFGRGKVIGTRTFGKASIQQFFPLQDGSAMILTTAKYLTSSGKDISNTGIPIDIPVDIPLEMKLEMNDPHFRYSFDRDLVLQEAIDQAILDM